MPEIPKKSRESKSYKGYSGPAPEKPKEEAKEYKGYDAPAGNGSKYVVMILIAAMLVLIVIGAGVLLYLFMTHPTITSPVNQTQVPVNGTLNLTNATVSCDDQCMLQNAIDGSDASLCINITNVSTRQSCYVLLSNTSFSVCLDLENGTDKAHCVTNYAVADNNVSLCSLLPAQDASSCMEAVNPCYAKNGSSRLLCLALASKNYSLCGSDKDCILNYSKVTGTTDACGQLKLVAEQYGCWAQASNTDQCAGLENQSQKDLCYEVYAIQTGKPQLCQDITPNNLYQTVCLSFFAAKLKSYSVCDNGLSLDNRWTCYTNYSLETGDSSGCAAIDPLATSSRFTCFYDYAMLWGDPSVCEILADPSQTNTCFIGSMVQNNTKLNYSNCDAINASQWKNKCYEESAIVSKDPSICSYIATDSERASCLGNLNITSANVTK